MHKLILLFICLQLQAFSQSPLEAMRIGLDKLAKEDDFKNGNISFTLLDQTTGKLILEKNKDLPLAPASTLKTYITAVALKDLGPDYRYKTNITFKGIIRNKIGIGQLIIHGSGDPSLGSDRYKETKAEVVKAQIVNGLKKLGIESFEGSVIIKSDIFSDNPINTGWLDEDVGNYYGAGVYGLNWRENKFEINLIPTKTSFSISSNNAGYDNQKDFCIELIHKDEATTEEAFAFIENKKPCMYVIKGVLSPKEKTHNMQLARLHPDNDFKRELIDALKKEMQFVSKDTLIKTNEIAVTTIYSPPLSQLVYWCNQKSLNLYAEAFCKTLAIQKYKTGTWPLGLRVMIQDAVLKKINMKKVYLKDACGLAPENRITTNILAQLLQSHVTSSYFKPFYESLPSMNGIIMKSGYIGGTRSYAGYLTLKDGRKTCFAFIVHGYSCKPKEAKLKMYQLLDLIKSDALPRQ